MSNEELVSQIQAGKNVSECMELLYNQNKGLIAKEARKYPAEYEDLMQEGYFALYEASMHFDEAQGASFSTYCHFWIRQIMQRYIDNGGAIRIPVGTGNLIKKYNKICREYVQKIGSEPSEDTLCALLEVDREKLHTIEQNRLYGQILSLEEPLGEDEEDGSIGDLIPSGESLEDETIRKIDAENMKAELWKAVDDLPDDLPDIIHQRYEDGKTLDQIADKQERSTSGIRLDLQKGENMLRHDRRSKGYKPYYDEYLNVFSYHVSVETFQRTGYSVVEEIVINRLEK